MVSYTLRANHRDTFRLVPVGSSNPDEYYHIPTNSDGEASFEAIAQQYYIYCRPAYIYDSWFLVDPAILDEFVYLRTKNPLINEFGILDLSLPSIVLTIDIVDSIVYVKANDTVNVTVGAYINGIPAGALAAPPTVTLYKADDTSVGTLTQGSYDTANPHLYNYSYTFNSLASADQTNYYFEAVPSEANLLSVQSSELIYDTVSPVITSVGSAGAFFLSSASAGSSVEDDYTNISTIIAVIPITAATDNSSGVKSYYLQPYMSNTYVSPTYPTGMKFLEDSPSGHADQYKFEGNINVSFDGDPEDLTFTPATAGNDDYIVDASLGFVIDGFTMGQTLTVTNTSYNNGIYTILSVAGDGSKIFVSPNSFENLETGVAATSLDATHGNLQTWLQPSTNIFSTTPFYITFKDGGTYYTETIESRDTDTDIFYTTKTSGWSPSVDTRYSYKIYLHELDDAVSWPITLSASGNLVQTLNFVQDLPSGFVVSSSFNSYGLALTASDNCDNIQEDHDSMGFDDIVYDATLTLAPGLEYSFKEGTSWSDSEIYTNENGWFDEETPYLVLKAINSSGAEEDQFGIEWSLNNYEWNDASPSESTGSVFYVPFPVEGQATILIRTRDINGGTSPVYSIPYKWDRTHPTWTLSQGYADSISGFNRIQLTWDGADIPADAGTGGAASGISRIDIYRATHAEGVVFGSATFVTSIPGNSTTFVDTSFSGLDYSSGVIQFQYWGKSIDLADNEQVTAVQLTDPDLPAEVVPLIPADVDGALRLEESLIQTRVAHDTYYARYGISSPVEALSIQVPSLSATASNLIALQALSYSEEASCSDAAYTTKITCEEASETWTPVYTHIPVIKYITEEVLAFSSEGYTLTWNNSNSTFTVADYTLPTGYDNKTGLIRIIIREDEPTNDTFFNGVSISKGWVKVQLSQSGDDVEVSTTPHGALDSTDITAITTDIAKIEIGLFLDSAHKTTLSFDPVQGAYFWKAVFSETISNVFDWETNTAHADYALNVDGIKLDTILAADLIVGGILRLKTGLSIWSGEYEDGERTGSGMTMDQTGLTMFSDTYNTETVRINTSDGTFSFGSPTAYIDWDVVDGIGTLNIVGNIQQVGSELTGWSDVDVWTVMSPSAWSANYHNNTRYVRGNIVLHDNSWWFWGYGACFDGSTLVPAYDHNQEGCEADAGGYTWTEEADDIADGGSCIEDDCKPSPSSFAFSSGSAEYPWVTYAAAPTQGLDAKVFTLTTSSQVMSFDGDDNIISTNPIELNTNSLNLELTGGITWSADAPAGYMIDHIDEAADSEIFNSSNNEFDFNAPVDNFDIAANTDWEKTTNITSILKKTTGGHEAMEFKQDGTGGNEYEYIYHLLTDLAVGKTYKVQGFIPSESQSDSTCGVGSGAPSSGANYSSWANSDHDDSTADRTIDFEFIPTGTAGTLVTGYIVLGATNQSSQPVYIDYLSVRRKGADGLTLFQDTGGNNPLDSPSEAATTAYLLPSTFIAADLPRVIVSATAPDFVVGDLTDSVTIYKLTAGTDSYNIILTNESHTVSTTSGGSNGQWDDAITTINLYKGTTLTEAFITSSTTYTEWELATLGNANPGDNPGISLKDTTASSSEETATATINVFDSANFTVPGSPTISDPSYVGSVIFTVTRVREGQAGETYSIVSDSNTIVYEPNAGTFTPTTLDFTATKKIGEGSASSYTAGYWRINGGDFDTAANLFPITIDSTYYPTPGYLTVDLATSNNAATIVDTESIPILDSSSDAYTLDLTNDTATASNTSEAPTTWDLTNAVTDINLYQGATLLTNVNLVEVTDLTGNWQYDNNSVWTDLAINDKVLRSDDTIRLTSVDDESNTVDPFDGNDAAYITFTFDPADDSLEGDPVSITFTVSKVEAGVPAVSLQITSDSQVFVFDDSDDTAPSPATVTITATQRNQFGENLEDGDLSTVTNGTKSNFSYSGSNGTGTATWTVAPDGPEQTNYPVTCIVTNDGLSDTITLHKVVGGLDSIPAKTIVLEAESNVFIEDANGDLSPNTIKFEVHKQNTDAAVAWTASPSVTFYDAAIDGSTTTSANPMYLRKTDYGANTSVLVTALCDNITDSATVVRLVEGSGTINTVLSNEAHVFQANSVGHVTTYTDSGTEIRCYEGANELEYDGAGTADGTWKAVVTTATNITASDPVDAGNYATVDDHEGVADGTDESSILYTITGTTENSTTFTITKTQSFSKSKAAAPALTAILSNETHTFQGDSDGVVTAFDNSGTTISVYEGASLVAYDGTGTTNSTFKTTATETNCSVDTSPNDDGNTVTYGNVTAVTTNSTTSKISFLIEGTDSEGTSFSITKLQTFSIANTGAAGEDSLTMFLSPESYTYVIDPAYPPAPIPDGDTIRFFVFVQNMDSTENSGIVTSGRIRILKSDDTSIVDTTLLDIDVLRNAVSYPAINPILKTINDSTTGLIEFTIENSTADIFIDNTTIKVKVEINTTATSGSLNFIDIVTVRQSMLGDDAALSYLTNENHTYSGDNSGFDNITESEGATEVRVEKGGVTYTKGNGGVCTGESSGPSTNQTDCEDAGTNGGVGVWSGNNTYAVLSASPTGLTGSAGGTTQYVYTPLTLQNNSGYVDFSITYDGITTTKRFSFSITRVGNTGLDAVVYSISATSDAVVYDPNVPSFSPSTVTFSATEKVGDDAPTDFETGYWSLDGGSTWSNTEGYVESLNPSTYHSSGNIAVQLALTSGGAVVDSETIPILDSSSDAYTIDLSNENVTIPELTDGVYDNSAATTVVRLYQGATEITTADQISCATSSADGTFSKDDGDDITSGTQVDFDSTSINSASMVFSHSSGVSETFTISGADRGTDAVQATVHQITAANDAVLYDFSNGSTYHALNQNHALDNSNVVVDDPIEDQFRWNVRSGFADTAYVRTVPVGTWDNAVGWNVYNASTSQAGTTINASGPGDNWSNTRAYSTLTYSNGCYLSWKPGSTGVAFMMGLTRSGHVETNDAAFSNWEGNPDGYKDIEYKIYAQQDYDIDTRINLGAEYNVASTDTITNENTNVDWTTDTLFEIIYDNSNIRLYVGGTLYETYYAGPGLTFHAYMVAYHDTTVVKEIRFLPYSASQGIPATIPQTEFVNVTQSAGAGSWSWPHSDPILIDATKTYKASGWFRKTVDSGSHTAYLAVHLTEADGTRIGGAGTWWLYPWNGEPATTNVWEYHEGTFGGGTTDTFPSEAVYMHAGFILNHSDGNSTHEAYDVKIEEASSHSNIGSRIAVSDTSLRDTNTDSFTRTWSATAGTVLWASTTGLTFAQANAERIYAELPPLISSTDTSTISCTINDSLGVSASATTDIQLVVGPDDGIDGSNAVTNAIANVIGSGNVIIYEQGTTITVEDKSWYESGNSGERWWDIQAMTTSQTVGTSSNWAGDASLTLTAAASATTYIVTLYTRNTSSSSYTGQSTDTWTIESIAEAEITGEPGAHGLYIENRFCVTSATLLQDGTAPDLAADQYDNDISGLYWPPDVATAASNDDVTGWATTIPSFDGELVTHVFKTSAVFNADGTTNSNSDYWGTPVFETLATLPVNMQSLPYKDLDTSGAGENEGDYKFLSCETYAVGTCDYANNGSSGANGIRKPKDMRILVLNDEDKNQNDIVDYMNTLETTVDWVVLHYPAVSGGAAGDEGGYFTFQIRGAITHAGGRVHIPVQFHPHISTSPAGTNDPGGYEISEAANLDMEMRFTRPIAGSVGAAGPGTVFRGDWVTNTLYTKTPELTDIVKESSTYYVCIAPHISDTSTKPGTGGSWEDKWALFGATFSSVATDLLLAQEAVITQELSVGEADNDTGRIISQGTDSSGNRFYVLDRDGITAVGGKIASFDIAEDSLTSDDGKLVIWTGDDPYIEIG